MKVADEDRNNSVFASLHWLLWFTRMPMGLKSEPRTFQHRVDISSSFVKWQLTHAFFRWYRHIFYVSIRTHRLLTQSLTPLNNARITLKLEKLEFVTNHIYILRHVVKPGPLEVSLHKFEAIVSLQAQSHIIKIRTFLGLSNVLLWFVPNFASIAPPVNH